MLLKSHLLQTHKSRRTRFNLAGRVLRKQQLEGPRAKARKIPRKRPSKEPRKPQLTPEIRRGLTMMLT